RGGPVAGVVMLRRILGALLITQMAGQLGLQTPLERGLDQRRHEPAVTGQLDLPGVDLLEQSIKLPRGLQLLDQVLARGLVRLLLVRHGHDSYRSSRYGLHRPSDTAREQRPDPLSCLTRTVELLPSTEPGIGTIQIHG